MKPVRWIGGSLEDLRTFPPAVRHTIGLALLDAQLGRKHPSAKPLRGFGGASVLEIVEDHSGATYRAVYTVQFVGVIYVLHNFKKKATRGIHTPKQHLGLIRARMKRAEEDYGVWRKTERK